jgi:hypothetical protein
MGNPNFAEVGIGAPNLIPNRVEIILLTLGQGGPSSFNFGFQANMSTHNGGTESTSQCHYSLSIHGMLVSMTATKQTTDKTILNFIVYAPLLKRIDDYRFKNRFQNRADAIKHLLDFALKANPKPKPEGN